MAYDPNYSIVVGGHVQAFGPNGETLSLYSNVAGSATLAALKGASLTDGATYTVAADGTQWRYAATSVLTADDFLVASPTSGTGRLLRLDTDIDITAAVTFATADAAVLYTVPAGFQLALGVPYIHVTTSWTGGSSSAIGASSSAAGLVTKGDLLGGSSGDVAAGLLSTGAYAKGTVGTDIGKPGALLVGGDTILFDRITSVFTAGAGVDHFPVKVLLAPAA
jgi:hypothetical protein